MKYKSVEEKPIIPKPIITPKPAKTDSAKVQKNKEYKITSDAIRTSYYLLSGSSSRKTIEDIKKDLIELLSK